MFYHLSVPFAVSNDIAVTRLEGLFGLFQGPTCVNQLYNLSKKWPKFLHCMSSSLMRLLPANCLAHHRLESASGLPSWFCKQSSGIKRTHSIYDHHDLQVEPLQQITAASSVRKCHWAQLATTFFRPALGFAASFNGQDRSPRPSHMTCSS